MKARVIESRLERLKLRFGKVTNLKMQYDSVSGYVNGHHVKITYLDGLPYNTKGKARKALRKVFLKRYF